jgi:hypothetical protein
MGQPACLTEDELIDVLSADKDVINWFYSQSAVVSPRLSHTSTIGSSWQ